MTEEWRPIKGYLNTYEVSNLGNVRNIKRGNMLKQAITPHGHAVVSLYEHGFGVTKRVHALVFKAFMEREPIGVYHRDRNPANNRLENLGV
jgi:hypothetical protein